MLPRNMYIIMYTRLYVHVLCIGSIYTHTAYIIYSYVLVAFRSGINVISSSVDAISHERLNHSSNDYFKSSQYLHFISKIFHSFCPTPSTTETTWFKLKIL